MGSADANLGPQVITDEDVVQRVLAGETSSYEVIMRRYSRRLYRVAYSILRDDADAEDAVQESYFRAYQHLAQFAGRAKFSTWLTRIVVHEALARFRRRKATRDLDDALQSDGAVDLRAHGPSPEDDVYNAELRRILELSIAALPDAYRAIVILRDVQELNTEETAQCLHVSVENVKVRLHRARAMMRRRLVRQPGFQRSA
jgi:RNA polymerase sigma-70 factor, ECF subfamily